MAKASVRTSTRANVSVAVALIAVAGIVAAVAVAGFSANRRAARPGYQMPGSVAGYVPGYGVPGYVIPGYVR
jgi:hypothetical protein